MTMRIPPGYTTYNWEIDASTYGRKNGYWVITYKHYLSIRNQRMKHLQSIEFQKALDKLPGVDI